ncbi:gfo/Idh/MocA family oxidoreductase [Gracilibacillus salitolerans]|uniref:Gfo/Idh/MocA family oxidoreductase n=1 Tax=Gracilibacillus salitolerans TaxID=2663022 RepID=A0A5Q2TF94_9BACI|nr:Gfo/Idh/MocA family oxidoreductase [Gracilibacillus salitolerans]QGH32812.1 gfo/Idh/MocA family oxidoreductase [Gracilibacillus salitolerans]
MNIGILGTGFGVYHAELYKKLNNINSITIFGRDMGKLTRIKEDLDVAITDDVNVILKNPDIDLVDICLPSSLHKKYVIEALKNDKDVFCETPFALTIEDANAMQLAENQYGRKVFVNQFIKHEQPYEYLYKVMQIEKLGKLKALHIKRKTPPLWGDLSLNKITTDLMIHDFDVVTWLLGKPNCIFSQGANGKQGQSHVNALLKYSDGIVSVEGSSMMPFGHPFTVGYDAIFESGMITYNEDGYKDSVETSFKLYADQRIEQIDIVNQNCYEESIKHVIECCKKDIPTRLSLTAAIKSLGLSIKIKEQILNGEGLS